MNQNTILLLVAIVVILALVLLFLVRGRKQRVTLRDQPATLARAATPAPTIRPIVAPAPSARDERHGMGSEVTAAIEDVVDQFVGLDAHPSGQDATIPHGDVLTRLKGLGPKAASRLGELGVTSFAQIASWDAGDVAAIDDLMGAFKGRIQRDRWVDQAKLLAAGDIEAFEAEFGKLGG